MSETDIPLIVHRRIQAPQQRLFQALARADHLAQWFRPDAETGLEVLAYSFVPEGRFRLRYLLADGRKPVVAGQFLRIDAPERVSFTWNWEPPDPLAGFPMHVLFSFDPVEPQATDVTVTHTGIPSERVCSVHDKGWETTLCYLEDFARQPKEQTR